MRDLRHGGRRRRIDHMIRLRTTPRPRAALTAVATAVALLAAGRAGAATIQGQGGRRTTAAQLSVEVQRSTLSNGLTVLLAPDPAGSSVAVWMSFRAGTLYEPPGRAGMAHLVEHLLASGPTPETDYATLLETRRARHFNASTGYDQLSFEVVVPSEELAAALWTAADRLGTLPALIDQPLVDRHRRVVVEERALRVVDVPYGLVEERLQSRLFAAPHPLHAGVGGAVSELGAVTADEVRAFVATYLVPANGVLVVAGRFDPAQALRLLADGLGRLPPGRAAALPPLPPPTDPYVDQRAEPLAREPRVSLAWRFPALPRSEGLALRLGGQMLGFMTDGAFGMGVEAGLAEYAGESVFQLDVTVPYGEPMSAMEGDAQGFLRFLTLRELPEEPLQAAHLALDRAALFGLDSLEGRAAALAALELQPPPRLTIGDHLGWHWKLDRYALRDTARTYLKDPQVVMHARPTRPRAAKLERE